MLSESEHIYEAALRLSDSERMELVTKLMRTIPDGAGFLSMDDENLIEELDRRSANTEGSIPWSQLRDQL